MVDLQTLRDVLGVAARAVGEDVALAGQGRERGDKVRRAIQWSKIDVVHIVEEGLRRQVVHLHQAAERGAMFGVVALLDDLRLDGRNAEQIGDERRHALIDLGEQIAGGGIERVVEIEHPRIDMREVGRRGV